mgnify:CR=1 FL=1
MASVNGGSGSLSWGIVPLNWDNTNLATMSYSYRSNYLKSVNDQLRYQIQWFYAGNNEGTEPVNSGDLVNVIFKVETSVDSVNWKTIGTVKKSRDIANRRYKTGTVAGGHRFTIDVSQLVSDELSYSLCPINKGTWQSPFYGGMNGGLTMQDNVIGSNAASGYPISSYNVSENGTFRRLRVSATFEVLDGNGQIVAATNTKSSTPYVTVINSVNQFEKDTVYYNQQFMHNEYSNTSTSPKRFLTRCPNWYYSTAENKVAYHKSVRMDEEAEFLQWYVRGSFPASDPDSTNENYNLLELYGTAYDYDGTETNFVMADFNSILDNNNTNTSTQFAEYQNRMLVQNVSPAFINANAKAPQNAIRPYTTSISPITSNTKKYSIHYRGVWYSQSSSSWENERLGASNWYEIDREDEKNAYGFVRFHWLNSMGGIDSYTAKRDVVEGLTISRDVVERKSGDRTWYQDDRGYANNAPFNIPDNDFYVSDTMRGGDIYKGGREVSNVNADRVQSVYTEPLNKSVAKWLEEMLLSPNVWIEMDTEATQMGYARNPYLRPSDKGYIPVIITNSDAETVNQAEGLVKFNIEYTLAHKVITQRN